MRICLVYDHLFPQTVGGAERWMRDLAVRLAGSGHDVTYLTMRHWEREAPELPGLQILGLTRPGDVYAEGRRTLMPPLRFGLAVARHLRAHGARYDVVHLASFPYFPVLAAAVLRRRRGYEVVVDWIEIWTRVYWRRYAGAAVGSVGWLVQRACVRVRHRAHCLSQLHARRLVEAGYEGTPVILPGLYAGSVAPTLAEHVDPTLVVYAGRHVREKRVDSLVRGFAVAHANDPRLRLELYGDGPDRARVETLVGALSLDGAVRHLGRRPEDEVAAAIARAGCLATASEREGYGLVVVEAAAHGTPSVVVAGSENAATELLEDGVNGVVSPDHSAEALGAALARTIAAGPALRESTARWFAKNAPRLTIDASLDVVADTYAAAAAVRSARR